MKKNEFDLYCKIRIRNVTDVKKSRIKSAIKNDVKGWLFFSEPQDSALERVLIKSVVFEK